MDQTCAACMDNFVTNLHPWWYDAGMFASVAVIVVALALLNWQRWTSTRS